MPSSLAVDAPFRRDAREAKLMASTSKPSSAISSTVNAIRDNLPCAHVAVREDRARVAHRRCRHRLLRAP